MEVYSQPPATITTADKSSPLRPSAAATPVTPDRTITSFETAESFWSVVDGIFSMETNDKKRSGKLLHTLASDVDETDNLHGEYVDDTSIPSNVGVLELEGLSRAELTVLVERLYQNLNGSNAALAKEQARRHNREKSLIKLAQELKLRREQLDHCKDRIEELQEELQMARSERSLMEQRLDSILAHDVGRMDEARARLSAELAEAQQRYETACRDFDLKIKEMKIEQKSISSFKGGNSPQQSRYHFLAPFSLSMALPLTFMFLSEVGSKSSYLSFGLWSVTLLFLLHTATATVGY
ncbi:hypothetical protein IV203_023331 [Nitzschia inconspicua]|uniref:Uncharacterized protein n=1 Tax=Nitzschia inconspicua TaxID=303405 RepID=A0A9K3PBZ8_9STRA|nr:hypothetical protein IV203_023331 [Nitzschia inconspicua]